MEVNDGDPPQSSTLRCAGLAGPKRTTFVRGGGGGTAAGFCLVDQAVRSFVGTVVFMARLLRRGRTRAPAVVQKASRGFASTSGVGGGGGGGGGSGHTLLQEASSIK